MDGFSVYAGALIDAASGVTDLMAELDAHSVSDLECDKSAIGHDGLADTLADFCNRWQYGVKNLTADGKDLATRLGQSAEDYINNEKAAVDALRRVGHK